MLVTVVYQNGWQAGHPSRIRCGCLSPYCQSLYSDWVDSVSGCTGRDPENRASSKRRKATANELGPRSTIHLFSGGGSDGHKQSSSSSSSAKSDNKSSDSKPSLKTPPASVTATVQLSAVKRPSTKKASGWVVFG